MLHYRTHVLGPEREWVVLVHGAGGSSSIWFRQLRAYTQEFNVLLVDLRGHGESAGSHDSSPINSYTFEAVSRDVLEVLDDAGIGSAHFVGISLGCLIIRTIADMAPQRVRSLVLGGAILQLNTRSRVLVVIGNVFKRVIPFMWLYRIYAWILMPRAGHRESRLIFVREAQKLARKEFLRWFNLSMQLPPILRLFEQRETGIPTLYLMGAEDHMFLPAARRIAAQHRLTLLRVIERCGHVVNIEKPVVFNRHSMEFMRVRRARRVERLHIPRAANPDAHDVRRASPAPQADARRGSLADFTVPATANSARARSALSHALPLRQPSAGRTTASTGSTYCMMKIRRAASGACTAICVALIMSACSTAPRSAGAGAGTETGIVDRPISFSEERHAMTRSYISEHYGLTPSDITIVPRLIVLHWTAIDDTEASFRVFNREAGARADLAAASPLNVSIHFLVAPDGTIYRLMPETWMARHVIGLNYNSIGVENVGGANGVDNLTDAQIDANIRLVKYLARKYPTIEFLIGHQEYQAFDDHPLWLEQDSTYRTTKIDPGERFMEAVRRGTVDTGLRTPPR